MADRLRVLIGEDDPVVAKALKAQLEGLGHSVAGIAHDGRDAVAKAETLTPDLIFLDIKMPGLDGVEATRQIMAHRPVPIILVTAHSEPGLIQRAMAAGVLGYLVKPVDRKELLPAIALGISRFADLMALRKDVESLKEALVLRQQVERAKGVLADRARLSEAEAHKRLQQFAQRERCSLAEAAARVIAADKFFADFERMA
jgi:AmiR/NasT family two-component response regulator